MSQGRRLARPDRILLVHGTDPVGDSGARGTSQSEEYLPCPSLAPAQSRRVMIPIRLPPTPIRRQTKPIRRQMKARAKMMKTVVLSDSRRVQAS